jgi:hypothetical protein
MKLCSKHWTVRRGKTRGADPEVVRLNMPRTCRTRSVRLAERVLGMLWFGKRDEKTFQPLVRDGNMPL